MVAEPGGSLWTVEEYLRMEPEHMAIQIFRRAADDTWPVTLSVDGDTITFESLGVRVPVAALYHKVRLPVR